MNDFHRIYSHDGFEAFLDLEKISSYGIDPGPRLWVHHDGRDYWVAVDVKEQFSVLHKSVMEFRGTRRPVEGIKAES